MYAIYISAARTRCEMVNTKKRERNFGVPHCYPMAGSGMVSRPKLMGPFSMTVPQLPLILAKCFLNSSPQPRERRKSTRIFWSTWISEQRKDRIAPRLSCVSIVNCKEKQTKIILACLFLDRVAKMHLQFPLTCIWKHNAFSPEVHAETCQSLLMTLWPKNESCVWLNVGND